VLFEKGYCAKNVSLFGTYVGKIPFGASSSSTSTFTKSLASPA